MIKKEIIEMLSSLPDSAEIKLTKEYHDLISNSISVIDINGYYKYKDFYVLTPLNIRPYNKESND